MAAIVSISSRAFAFVLAASVLLGCAGYVPGRKAYWDIQLEEMCAKDGGVTIFEAIAISTERFDRLEKVGGYASIPPRQSAKVEDPLFWDESVTVLHDANPRVWRSEQIVRRKTDERVMARVVRYSRVGGDIPSPAHSSHFGCPAEEVILAKRQGVFAVQESGK